MMSTANGGEGGTIINISSLSALIPIFHAPVYSATKSFLFAYTKAMAHNFNTEKHGVKFIVICPGATRTTILNGIKFPYPYYKFYKLPRFLYNIYQKYGTLSIQKTSVVGECVILALSSNKNGALWLSNNSVNAEVDPSMTDGKHWREIPLKRIM